MSARGNENTMKWTDAGLVGAGVGAWAVLNKCWDVWSARIGKRVADNTVVQVRVIDEAADIRHDQRDRITALETAVKDNQEEIRKLSDSLAEERGQNKALLENIKTLTADNRALIEDNTTLKHQNADLKETNAELKAQNAEWKQQITGLQSQMKDIQNNNGGNR